MREIIFRGMSLGTGTPLLEWWSLGQDTHGVMSTQEARPPSLPDYLNDHNAVQRVIDGLDDARLYHLLIRNIVRRDSAIPHEDKSLKNTLFWDCEAHKATPTQKVEAILKATGNWEK